MDENKFKVGGTGHWFTVKLNIPTGEFFYFRVNVDRESLKHLELQDVKEFDVEQLVKQKIELDVKVSDSHFNKEIYNKYKDEKYRRVEVSVVVNKDTNKLNLVYS